MVIVYLESYFQTNLMLVLTIWIMVTVLSVFLYALVSIFKQKQIERYLLIITVIAVTSIFSTFLIYPVIFQNIGVDSAILSTPLGISVAVFILLLYFGCTLGLGWSVWEILEALFGRGKRLNEGLFGAGFIIVLVIGAYLFEIFVLPLVY